MNDPADRVALGTFKVCADEYGCPGGAATLATRRPNLGRFVFGWFVGHRKPMRRQCQFTVKRSEKRGVLTVAAKSLQSDKIVHGLEQQPCGVQVVWFSLPPPVSLCPANPTHKLDQNLNRYFFL